jgi:hypothetical protein
MADRRQMLAQALSGDGVSPQTKRGLIDSGAMTPGDLNLPGPAPVAPAPAPIPARGIGRQMSQAEHDQMQAAQNAAAAAHYQAWKASRGR